LFGDFSRRRGVFSLPSAKAAAELDFLALTSAYASTKPVSKTSFSVGAIKCEMARQIA
jgi:hypothetical protein